MEIGGHESSGRFIILQREAMSALGVRVLPQALNGEQSKLLLKVNQDGTLGNLLEILFQLFLFLFTLELQYMLEGLPKLACKSAGI